MPLAAELAVLEHSSHRATNGQSAPVQGVDETAVLALFGADRRPTGLEVATDAAAGDLAVGTRPRKPNLKVEGALG